MAFKLRSRDFEDGQLIPIRSTVHGESMNPHLRWSGVPAGTRELALLCEDPDAPTPKPVVHWLVHELDATTTEIPRGLEKQGLVEWPIHAKQGLNSFLLAGYRGPYLGFFEKSHRYVFRLFALSKKLELPDLAGRSEFLKAIQGNVIEEARLVGLYHKTPAQKARAIALWSAGLGLAGYGVLRLTGRRRAA